MRFGKRAVHDYIGLLLIEEEAETYGIKLYPEVLEQKVQERIRSALGGKTKEIFAEGLRRGGQSFAMYESGLRTEVRKDLLLDRLTLATRVATDARIQGAFEAEYGPAGVKTEVRHILFMPNVLRAEKVRAGAQPADLDMATLKAEARSLANETRKAILHLADDTKKKGGASEIAANLNFQALAKERSHDRVSRETGGLIAHYGGRIYGDVFGATVKNLQPGDLSNVIETGAGFHIVMVDSRVRTQLEDVKALLVKQILAAPPSMHEKSSYLQALQSKAKIQMW